MRDTTERPERVTAGTLKLAGTQEEDIYTLEEELLNERTVYKQIAQASNSYGDGQASDRIVQADSLLF